MIFVIYMIDVIRGAFQIVASDNPVRDWILVENVCRHQYAASRQGRDIGKNRIYVKNYYSK